jgi:hypothetical protein
MSLSLKDISQNKIKKIPNSNKLSKKPWTPSIEENLNITKKIENNKSRKSINKNNSNRFVTNFILFLQSEESPLVHLPQTYSWVKSIKLKDKLRIPIPKNLLFKED